MSLIHNATFDSQTRILSLLDKAGNVISSCEVPSKGDPLTLTATANNSGVELRKYGTLSNTYEVNVGSGWTAYSFGTVINLNAGQSCRWRCSAHPTTQSSSNYVQFNMRGKIEASGNVNSMLSSDFDNLTSLSGYDYAFFKLFSGCTSLTNAPELPATSLAPVCYMDMFENCTSLTNAPELPAINLATECYRVMFWNCTSLTTAPSLPATSLARWCCAGMFGGCTSLTNAPSLPATSLAERCYSELFYNCTSLTNAPSLPATSLAEECYHVMFWNCTSLTTAPSLPATSLASGCYYDMFKDCTSLTNAPSLPATSLAEQCYFGMFRKCTSLTNAPSLPATSLAEWCYSEMFKGCSALTEVRISATTTATNALRRWLSVVSASGTVYADPNFTDLPTNSVSGIPQGWTRRDINLLNALTLTATADNSSVKLTKNGGLSNTYEVNTGSGWQSYTFGTVIHLNSGQSCKWRCSAHPTMQSGSDYVKFGMTGKIEASGNVNSMLSSDFGNITSLSGYGYAFVSLFQDCRSLTKAPSLPATTLADSCYYKMFYGCESLVQAPELPALSIPDSFIYDRTNVSGCYVSMFEGCIRLEQAPALPATTLGKGCYVRMFYGCTSLVEAPALPATSLPDALNSGGTSGPAFGCYSDMFGGCRSLVQAPALPATTLGGACYGWMFYECTSLKEIRVSATDISADRCTASWLQHVSSTGDFYCNPDTAWTTDSNGCPSGWTKHALSDYPQS